jgi:geranylgeranyl pyrophosphate synthase
VGIEIDSRPSTAAAMTPRASDPHLELPSFIEAVEARARQTVTEAELPAQQRALLMRSFRAPKAGRVLAHQMAPFYFLIRAHGRPADALVEEVGAAFMLVQRGVSMIDKVEDDDLDEHADEGESWAALGHAVALNAGITTLVLGIDALWALEARYPRLAALRQRIRHHLLRMSGGQHRELVARGKLLELDARLAIAADKATEFSLLTELAGVCVDAELLPIYRGIGRELAVLVQIVNDLADLLGPKPSDDLRTGTLNIPVTTLLFDLEPAERERWLARLGQDGDGDVVVRALYDRGLMQVLAERVEAGRESIHRSIAELPCAGPYRGMFLAWVDDLAAALYRPPRAETSADERGAIEALTPGDRAIHDRLLAARAG